MQRLLKRIRIWFGLELEQRKWWDQDPIYVIEGPALAEALRHLHLSGRAAA